eukprot:2594126-Rhodomonas_salina.2
MGASGRAYSGVAVADDESIVHHALHVGPELDADHDFKLLPRELPSGIRTDVSTHSHLSAAHHA